MPHLSKTDLFYSVHAQTAKCAVMLPPVSQLKIHVTFYKNGQSKEEISPTEVKVQQRNKSDKNGSDKNEIECDQNI